MEENRTVEELLKEQKKLQRKAWMEQKVEDVKTWGYEHKEILVVAIPMLISGASTVAKAVGKNINLRKEEDLKDLYCYDRSLGHYWKLRRKLTNAEWLEINERKQNGEALGDILEDLRVLD